MDFVMMYRLIRCLNEGVALDLSVYDGALWSLVGVLSERSVAQGNQRVDIPDVSFVAQAIVHLQRRGAI